MDDTKKPITKKRVRRTKEAIEQDLFDSTTKIIEEVGFSNLSVTRIIKEAKIEPNIFYNRYKDIDDFIDKFIRQYDYWLNDEMDFNPYKIHPVESITNLLVKLVDSLIDNICMQKLIAWEMNDDNYITRRASLSRDLNSRKLIEYFNKAFEQCEANFDFSTAIIIGGIYYLVIHREIGTFNFIDFTTKEGIEGLKENLRIIIKNTFHDFDLKPSGGKQKSKNDTKTIRIAKKLIENKIDYDIIKESTGLNDTVLRSLYA